MSDVQHNPWVHRWAVLTVVVALLPVSVGALVTTLDAGMAFPDWPTSDGHNMFLYPWLQSAGAEFVEHGHRLAGVLIGLVAIALTIVTQLRESRRWVKYTAVAVLLGVVAQGLLGGGRVRLDERSLAMLHGQFGAWVVSLMALLACFTSRGWRAATDTNLSPERANRLMPLTLVTPLVVMVQYTLGGMVRHFHTALDEHLVFAFVAATVVLTTATALILSGVPWLRRIAVCLILLVLVQVGLGAGAWITRWGLSQIGYVATARSLEQTWLRTLHTVVGMLLLATSFVAAARTCRVAAAVRSTSTAYPASASVMLRGGAS